MTLLMALTIAAIFTLSAHAAIQSKRPLLAVPALVLVVMFTFAVLAANHIGGLQ